MPHVTYTPEGETKQEWDLRYGRVISEECKVIERAAGCTYDEWQQKVSSGDTGARQILLWYLQKRTHPTLRLADVQFFPDDLLVEATHDEMLKLRVLLADAPLRPGFTEDDRTGFLATLDSEIAKHSTTTPPPGEDGGDEGNGE